VDTVAALATATKSNTPNKACILITTEKEKMCGVLQFMGKNIFFGWGGSNKNWAGVFSLVAISTWQQVNGPTCTERTIFGMTL
jgi:hypothetical protein